jgi:hypothetical protein
MPHPLLLLPSNEELERLAKSMERRMGILVWITDIHDQTSYSRSR